MSYSFDTDGLDLFSTPFSTPIRTGSASSRQQAKQTPPTAAQPPKRPQPARKMADTPQKPTAVQQGKPVPVATAPASHEKPAPKTPTPSQDNTLKPEPVSPPKAPVPATPGELAAEGNALHHCVGRYAGSVAKQECMILFLRRCSDETKPFYTIEVRGREIIQVRGIGNCAATPEVQRFINAFKRQVLQGSVNKAA